jgi:hypothetical protein
MLTESECAQIRSDVEKRVRKRLCDPKRKRLRKRLRVATPSDVLAPITRDLMRFSTPFFVFSDDARVPVLVGVRGLDDDALTELRGLLTTRRLTLGQAINRAASPVTRAALNTIYVESLIREQKAWALTESNAGRIAGVDVPAATATMEPEFTRTVLATPMSSIVRAQGNMVAPLLQKLIVPIYDRLLPYYGSKGYVTERMLRRRKTKTPGKTKTRRKPPTARYPTGLLSDIGDLVTAHWGHVIGRVDHKRVRSCVQAKLEGETPRKSRRRGLPSHLRFDQPTLRKPIT